jgi:hypothetical protein
MRALATSMYLLLLVSGVTHAQQITEVQDVAHHPFSVDFPSGEKLDMDIRSGEIHIVGTDENKVVVQIGGSRGADSTDIKARFRRFGNSGKLRITGGPHNDLTITVRVPKSSDLFVRVLAGDVAVSGITGNKDIELHFGDLKVGIGEPTDYANVQASVSSGEIEAKPFGESLGGLFRSFKKSGAGKYKLTAHVGAGDLTLD